MMKRMAAFLALTGIVFLITSFKKHSPESKPVLRTIVIDAGHGGDFHGTRGLISKEEDVTLDIALKLGEAIKTEFPDIKVVYTRTTNANVGGASTLKEDLHNRAQIANQAKGDLFISIHCDATVKPPGGYYEKRVIGHKKKLEYVGRGKRKRKKMVNAPIYESYWVKNTRVGASVLIWKAEKSSDKTNAINDGGGGEFEDSTDNSAQEFDLGSPEAKIRAELYEQRYFKKSVQFGSMVMDEIAKAGRKTLGVYQRDKGIQVLQATGMPSVVIETGYLTNKEEEEYLNSDDGQNEVVRNIIDALKRYKQQLENGKTNASATDSNGNNK
ncbi:MAG: N-acetylmuramoyl-L-alanine amidase [Bacteroidetes bacterium]|nr:N-acetylmuramoyl-L-alanine amidase [Bacteroidota bacterium]